MPLGARREPLRRCAASQPPSSPSTSSASPECGLVVGNAKLGIRSNLDTAYERSELIGHLFPLIRPRADAGDVLALIDTCAGKAAFVHMHGHKCEGRFVVKGNLSMATVSFNSFMFTQPVYQGDLIKLETRIVHTGDSSIGVYVRVRRQAYDSPTHSVVGESFVTMVMVHAGELTKVASGHVPAVRLIEPVDVVRRATYLELRRLAKGLTRLQAQTTLSAAEVENAENRSKQHKLKPCDCLCRIVRTFSVSDVNVNKAIFGGEVLRFMEKCALHCGRVFARQARLYTLGMMDMTFDGPLFLSDLANCKAQVACVRRSTMMVNVSVDAVNTDGETRSTNRASFLLVAIDPQGKPFEIVNGIDLEGASQGDLERYWRGRCYMAELSRRRQTKAHPPRPEAHAG